MKQKILLFTENFPPIEGGSGRWFWELYNRLGAGNVVIVTHDVKGSTSIDASVSATVVRIPLQSPEWGLKSLQGLKFYWRSVSTLKRLIKQYDIDEVHCGRVIHEGVTAWLLSLFTGLKYRCFIHGEDVETAATSREQSMMVKQVCKRAYTLICNSENSKNLTQKLGYDSGEKCIVLHPGVDVDRFVPKSIDTQFRNAMGWADKFVVLTVGRLQQRKGQDYFIRALPDIVKAIPNCLYVVIGSGECKGELVELVEQLNLHDHVQFQAGLDDQTLISCYQQCDRFVLPNRTIANDIEGFGMVLVEAQACGKPVVAGDSGGTRETMKIGATGHIIDCSTAESIAKEIVPILTAPSLSPDVYREHVMSHFTWEGHLGKFIAMMDE